MVLIVGVEFAKWITEVGLIVLKLEQSRLRKETFLEWDIQTIAKVQPEHVCGLPTGSNDLSVGSTMGHSTGNTLNVSACILQKKIEI